MNRWDYRGIYEKYDMGGEIEIGTGIVKVHDILDGVPGFAMKADCIFVDPPCNKGNLNSFYTKAGSITKNESYEPFLNALFELVKEVNPSKLFIEVFKSNKDKFLDICSSMYPYVEIYESMYYGRPSNRCWVIHCQREPFERHEWDGLDEQRIIELVCRDEDFSCIYDPCMGKGLVGFYANKYGKRFAGTELNPKRLAVLIERINTGRLLMK